MTQKIYWTLLLAAVAWVFGCTSSGVLTSRATPTPDFPVAWTGDSTASDARYAMQPGRNQPGQMPSSFASSPVQLKNKRLAVLEFQGKNLDNDILMTFSDTIRGGALQGIGGQGVVVMTRENMLVLLRDMGKQECGEGECEVETARNIGADFVISGKVVRVEQLYVVTLKLHETKDGSLLSQDTVEGKSQVELMRSLREHSRQLTTSIFTSRR